MSSEEEDSAFAGFGEGSSFTSEVASSNLEDSEGGGWNRRASYVAQNSLLGVLIGASAGTVGLGIASFSRLVGWVLCLMLFYAALFDSTSSKYGFHPAMMGNVVGASVTVLAAVTIKLALVDEFHLWHFAMSFGFGGMLSAFIIRSDLGLAERTQRSFIVSAYYVSIILGLACFGKLHYFVQSDSDPWVNIILRCRIPWATKFDFKLNVDQLFLTTCLPTVAEMLWVRGSVFLFARTLVAENEAHILGTAAVFSMTKIVEKVFLYTSTLRTAFTSLLLQMLIEVLNRGSAHKKLHIMRILREPSGSVDDALPSEDTQTWLARAADQAAMESSVAAVIELAAIASGPVLALQCTARKSSHIALLFGTSFCLEVVTDFVALKLENAEGVWPQAFSPWTWPRCWSLHCFLAITFTMIASEY